MIRRLVFALGALLLSTATHGQTIPPTCSTPNYYSGAFHPGCLSAADLNNNNTAIAAAITASGALYVPKAGGTMTGALNGTTGSFSGFLSAATPGAGDNTNKAATTNFVWSWFAPKASPAFTGVPTAPTAIVGTNTNQIATTAFVSQYIIAGFAPIDSPAFTGIPTAPTAAVDTDTTQLATTAFVIGQAAVATPLMDGTAAVGTATLFAREDHVHPTDTTRAAQNNANLTGTPTAPTAAPGTSTTQLATTAYVATTYAPLASPALTGVPTAPTAAVGTNTTQVASMAAVHAAAPQIGAGKLLGNPGAAIAVGGDVTVGDSTTGNLGMYLSSTGVLSGPPPVNYQLTLDPDSTGIGGGTPYYTASRAPGTVTGSLAPVPLTSTTVTVVASFVTPPGDPGLGAMPRGNVVQKVYLALDAGSANISMQILARSVDGTESSLGTPTADAVLTSTSPIAVTIPWAKTNTAAMNPTDRVVFKVRAQRIAGSPATINVTFSTDNSTMKSAASTTGAGNGQFGPDYVVNVVDYLAKRDLIQQPDGVIGLGSNQLCSASATFKPADASPPKAIEVNDMLGQGLAPFVGTIIAYVSPTCVTISGTATAATSGIQYLSGATTSFGGTSGTYVPTDQVCLLDGTFTVQSCLTLSSTRVRPSTDTVPAFTIVNAGSGGLPGTTYLRGTTGTGTTFTARGTIAADGTLASVEFFNGGVYLTNPSNLASEPVTSDAALAGAILAIGGMDAGVVTVQTAGSYSVIPDDPVASTCGSVSAACGATFNASWQSVGRFAYGTDNNAFFTAAINRANAIDSGGGRTIIRIPAGNYFFTGAALPVSTQPIFFQGDGRSQTQLYFSGGYTGTYAIGWSNLFPSNSNDPPGGPTEILSASTAGAGADGITVAANRNATVLPDAFVFFDRVSNAHLSNLGGFNVGSFIRTGILLSSTVSYLRESYIGDVYCSSCGTAAKPVIWFEALGSNAKNNNIQINNVNVVFPIGPGVAFTSKANTVGSGTKAITGDYIRVERGTAAQVAGTGDLLQFGSPTDTDDVRTVILNSVLLVSPQAGGNCAGFYGPTEATRPHDISLTGFSCSGSALGGGINIQAGANLNFQITNLGGRSGQIITGNHTDNRLVTTAAGGATTSAVPFSAGSSTNSFYVGGALVHTVPAAFTASINSSNVMTVAASPAPTGRIVVGSIIRGSGINPVTTVTALGTGTGGAGTYTVNQTPAKTIASRVMTGTWTESRNITVYVGSTRTATVGTAFTYAPQSGDALAVQSLVNGTLFIDGAGAERSYSYSGLGLNVAPLISTPLFPMGIPTGTQTISPRLYFQAGVQIGPGTYPANQNDPCSVGDFSWKAGKLAICTATNSWGAATLTWP